MLSFYQYLPAYINPVAFRIGSLEIRWYAIMYLMGFLAVYWLLIYRIKQQEFSIFNFQFSKNFQSTNFQFKNLITDFLLYAIIGLLIGARVGYVLFYNLPFYLKNPLAIVSPLDAGGNYVGIMGMSYYGGVIGIVLAALFFTKKHRINFWQLADFVAPAIPAGYFFGRLGNFINGELFGRMTDKPWGMYFSDGALRHPSQLYEALFEGLVIFLILWTMRNKRVRQGSNVNGQMLLLYLFLYGFFRFFIEFFRQPDPQIGLIFGWLTLGQVFSVLLMAVTVYIFFYKKSKTVHNITR